MIVYLLTLHLIADFILQPREMGKNKSNNLCYWLGHVVIQFIVFQVGLLYILRSRAFDYALANAIIHGVIDALTWRCYAATVWSRKKSLLTKEEMKVKFKYWEDHWFYVTIGIDQWLHSLTIILLWQFFSV